MAQTGFTPIQLYTSTTAAAAPTSGNLAQGELAINITDGKLFYKDTGGVVRTLASGGTSAIGGADTQVQFNSGGALAGSVNMTFNGTTLSAAALASAGQVTFSSLGAMQIPAGSTGNRPGSPVTALLRFNTTLTKAEIYNGTVWASVGGGATGGGSDEVFIENGQNVTTNYTIPVGKNASSVGPITIASGQAVTIPSGSRWVVL